MTRIKYYYDTKTCNYERIKTSRWDFLFDLLGYLIVSLALGVIISLLYHAYFDSPKEARLKKENETLRLHYELIQQEVNKGNAVLAYLQDRDDNIYRTILEVDPIPSTVRKAGVGGIDRYKKFPQDSLIASTVKKVDQLKRQLYIQTKSYDDIARLAKDKEKRLAATPAIQPISNRELKRLSSGFGMRTHPIYKVPKMHYGVDFSAPRGTPVYATGDGVVRLAKKSYTGYGNRIEINHGYGLVTRYCHLQSFNVKYGQKVKRGERIGCVGSTGLAAGPHLHYEVLKNGKNVNPVHYFFDDLTAADYDKLIRLASIQNQSLD
ncbi:MAG: M23 family metallopeptidase [Bacteroidota bacterium]